MAIIYALLGAFQGLPGWTRWVFVAMSIAIVLGFGALLDTTVAIIVILGLVAVGLLVGVFWGVLQKRRAQRAEAFGSELREQASNAPGAISDPARRARLHDLQRNFEGGVEKFRVAGKNLYDVPWYVIVGEPGAGKTEAIRHSNVGFPPGMQDEFQGVGGTINMNWWFTNDAVILDTAGRLLFEEVEPGTTGEWRVFLEMLKKHRPNCPINGLCLAIPAESLIKDSPEQIQRKAGKIAQQLEVIQRQLDVRFPVFVVITKCDLLNGFREFFDDLVDPQAQQQMMGWSNPDPLDASFRLQLIDEHIYTVVERLRRRRLGLMLDPVARSTERRTDEVDRLFSLPHSVSLIAPNLRQYLEVIFTAGMWSVRPLFLRGIYFTSSLREGSALDQELAQILGLDVDTLPEGRAWERERSYFLRDLFIEKAFRERGLVTRATDTKKLMLRRRLTLLSAGVGGLMLLLGLSWFGYQSLKSSIGNQAGYWARASEDWTDKTWKAIVRAETPNRFVYTGDEPVGPESRENTRLHFSAAQQPLAAFQLSLQELSKKPLDVPFVFRPLTRFGVNVDSERSRAQRVVFEGGVTKPLVDAARSKMIGASVDPNARANEARIREGDALLALVRLEAGIVKRREQRPVGAFNGDKFLPPLFRYVSGETYEKQLPKTLDAGYSDASAGKVGWPPDWLSAGLSLAENTPIAAGLGRFIEDANRTTKARVDGLPLIIKAIEELRQWQRAENSLFTAAGARSAVDLADREVLDATDRLIQQKERLDLALAQLKNIGLFEGGPVLLSAAYERLFGELRLRYDQAIAIETEISELLPATNVAAIQQAVQSTSDLKKEYVLFREIRDKLKGVLAELEQKFKGTLSDTELAELRTLDELHLTDIQSGAVRYEVRWALYAKSLKAAPDPRGSKAPDLLGQQWKPLADAMVRIPQIRQEVDNFEGSQSNKVQVICRYCLIRAERELGKYYASAYVVQAREKLGEILRFPLVGGISDIRPALKPEEFVPAVRLVERVKADLDSPVVQGFSSDSKQPLLKLRQNLDALNPIVDALLTPDKQMRLVTIMLLGRNDQLRLAPQTSAIDAFQQTELRVGTVDHAMPVRGGPQRVATGAPGVVELGKFEFYTPFHFHFYRIAGEARPLEVPAPPDWTSLRILEESRAIRMADGRRWQIAIQPVRGKLVWYEFRFDAPLPEFDDWPKRTLLDVEASPRR